MNLQEITNRLEKIEERRNLALSASYVGIWDWDIINNSLWWDEKMLDLYEMTKEEFSNSYEGWRQQVFPQDLKKLEKAIKLCLEENKRYVYRFRINTKKGVKSIIGFGNCIRNEKNKPIRMVGINILETELCDDHELNIEKGTPCSTCPSLF